MASLSITVPDGLVPAFVQMAEAFLPGLGVDLTGMTNAQKARRYAVEILKIQYRAFVTNQAQSNAQAQAAADAGGIV